MKKINYLPTNEETRLFLENDILKAKSIMYSTLALFLIGQSVIAYLVATLLAILLIVVLIFGWFFSGHDVELIRLILKYELPGLFPQ
jgi:hypothetical protein